LRWTARANGHLGLARPGAAEDTALDARRRAVVDLPWAWLHQVHGAEVVVAGEDTSPGVEADALVTTRADVVLAVFTADCASVALASPEGVIGLAHCGWRGLVAGVVGRTIEAMRALGATDIVAGLGPCIRAGCYEFGADDLDLVAALLGDQVRATTTWGTSALDLAAGARLAAERAGAAVVVDAGACTACSDTWYSHRSRHDQSRQATLLWVPSERT
jgi:YfiH family protein